MRARALLLAEFQREAPATGVRDVYQIAVQLIWALADKLNQTPQSNPVALYEQHNAR